MFESQGSARRGSAPLGCMTKASAISIFSLVESVLPSFDKRMEHYQPKTFTHSSKAVAAQELVQTRKFTRQLLKDPQKVRSFLIEGGFITRSGKLSKRYGG